MPVFPVQYLSFKRFQLRGLGARQDTVDFIAIDGRNDDPVLVATEARANEGGGFASFEPNRAAFERLAAAYLTGADLTDRTVKLDVVSMLVLSGSRALIKHHVNVLSAWSGDVGL